MRLPSFILTAVCASALPLVAAELHVGPGHPHATLASAVAAASPGDTIFVHAGRHAGSGIRIAKSIQLIGIDRPVIDGALTGEVITIAASDVSLRGFVICNGGRSSTNDLAGIRIESAQRVVVADNEILNCNYAIYLARARDCAVEGNVILGEPDQELNSGNGIHLWNCESITVSGNQVMGHRDGIYLEYASKSVVADNLVEQNLRYGLHFMFSHDSAYRQNRFTRNGAGVAVMYSRHVDMGGNRFDHNWGGSSYGLLLKDLTDSRIHDNVFERNSTGVYAQGANRVRFERNQFRQNGWALRILANGTDNQFEENEFTGNSFDVGTNGQLSDHRFSRNHWDRYEGYDLNRDGIGDVPYRPVSLYALLIERVPASMLLMRSFMVHLLDRAERAFPSITPDSVVDESPALRARGSLVHPASLSNPTSNPTKP